MVREDIPTDYQDGDRRAYAESPQVPKAAHSLIHRRGAVIGLDSAQYLTLRIDRRGDLWCGGDREDGPLARHRLPVYGGRDPRGVYCKQTA
jgi:hypothetical protein